MVARTQKSTLNATAWAPLFGELATILNTGLSLEYALVTINTGDGASGLAAKLMLIDVRSGSNLTITGPTARVFDPLDLHILRRRS